MEDPNDPLVAESDVPSFNVLEKKIKELDNAIIIYRIYYFFDRMAYRLQLLRKERMCIIEIPRALLEDLGRDGTSAEREISHIISLNIEDEACWKEIQQ